MLTAGARIGEYEVLAPLRTGGMAALYLGRRAGAAGFTKPVAIKVIHPHLAHDPSFIEMFLDEARLSARIQDPNVVHVEDLGEADGMFYLAMEYVLGAPLSALLARLVQGGLSFDVPMACAIAMRVADGLHAAHELRDDDGAPLEVVHRDVSPQNVLLSEAGHVKLIDFGVARARGRLQETEAGALKGKVRYMSPEQAWGRPIDRRTDVYALAIVLWEMLVLRRFIEGSNDIEALELARAPNLEPPSKHRAGIPPDLDRVILTALSREPSERFETAQAFRRALSNAVPEALRVEPGDIAALVESQLGRQLAEERRLLTAPGRTSQPSASPHEESPGEAATRASSSRSRGRTSEAGPIVASPSAPAPRAASPSAPSPSAPAASASAPSPPSSEASPVLAAAAPAAGASTSNPWLLAAIVLVLLVTVGALSFVAGWFLPSPPVSSPATSEAPVVPAPSAPVDPCAGLTRVVARMNETVHVALDTTEARSRFALLGLRSPDGEPAPDAVVEIQVPGDARTTLVVSTSTPDTDERYDTILAAFDAACSPELASARPMFSADDHGRERHARGAFAARGGSTVTVVVSGFGQGVEGMTDRGRVSLEITAHPSSPPVLTAARATVAGGTIAFRLQGHDGDLDADRARVRLFGEGGGALPVVARGERSELPLQTILLPIQHDPDVDGVGLFLIRSDDVETLSRAHRAEVALVDRAGNATSTQTIELVQGQEMGPLESCDETHLCATELGCGADARCAASPERSFACQSAQTLTPAPGERARVTRALPAGYALFETPCAETYARGREDVISTVLPDGLWDLVVSTAPSEERAAPADMVLSVRTDCLDARPTATPEGGCNDDRSAESRRPRVELREVVGGTRFWIFASAIRPDPRFETGGLEYELELELRAVRARGETCDPSGARDRCVLGGCSPAGRCE
jgi:serine/threonine protein kinase